MRERKVSTGLFNFIAPVYGLFFTYQRKRYGKTLEAMHDLFTTDSVATILDVGCGTGALCRAFADLGFRVTGVDPALRMLQIARNKNQGKPMEFIEADATQGLPFADRQFDVVIASYVAHGMKSEQRKKLYHQMSRVAKHHVIIHDYNAKRSPFTSFIEYLEGGDYFHFIGHAQTEMETCIHDLQRCFAKVEVIQVGKRANWYLCTPEVSD
ncbi:MAG: class I SAM-dependent methyltransferase [Sphaerochaeta sp.]|jgi:ubiquinone/menaquinone biosynthesis C-methylase UbiE|uniref:class I SAM-dependent methyltransferase n=1 Tax=Sphaerochaeta sp. TaxID=1972642 RepID=UPI002FC61965